MAKASAATRARWIIERREHEIVVTYHNLSTDQRHHLGSAGHSVDDDELIRWIVEVGQPACCDEIVLGCGSVLRYAPTGVGILVVKLEDGRTYTREQFRAA